MANYVVSERDYQRLQTMLRWFEREKNLRDKFRRRNSNVGVGNRNIRSAKIQSISGKVLTVKLWVYSGGAWNTPGDNIDVNCTEYHLGSNDLDGDVWPDYIVNDSVQIFQDMDGNWYPIPTFDDVEFC